jgi:transposase InsO family protein
MSQAVSPSAQRPYGLLRVARVWKIARSSVYAIRARLREHRPAVSKRGPATGLDDAGLLQKIRDVLAVSPWVGEGYRKVWARLRAEKVRTAPRRVLRLMREAGLLAPGRLGNAHGPKAHDGTILAERPDVRWGTDATSTLTDEGNAAVFVVVDHCTAECVGIHAARRGTRWEALEALRQGVRQNFGEIRGQVADGLELRHDHGSAFISDDYQDELTFLGIKSSPSYVREPEGNGCSERFIRTLKEQLLWLRRFATVAELEEALQEFRERYNHQWLVQRHGYRTPAAVRAELLAPAKVAA